MLVLRGYDGSVYLDTTEALDTVKKPTELNIPMDKFKEFFGVDWDEAVEAGKVLNAKDACEKLQIDGDAINENWEHAKKDKKLIKFGGGFYCASLPYGEDQIYVFNGFFMSMRSKFVAEGVSIYYYMVDWESSACAWEDFRGKVLGPTDPEAAPTDSLHGAILAQWEELGLESKPDTGDNGVHASASWFEALLERVNWLGYRADREPFGKFMLKVGVSPIVIKEWSDDPQVTFGVLPMNKSTFQPCQVGHQRLRSCRKAFLPRGVCEPRCEGCRRERPFHAPGLHGVSAQVRQFP